MPCTKAWSIAQGGHYQTHTVLCCAQAGCPARNITIITRPRPCSASPRTKRNCRITNCSFFNVSQSVFLSPYSLLRFRRVLGSTPHGRLRTGIWDPSYLIFFICFVYLLSCASWRVKKEKKIRFSKKYIFKNCIVREFFFLLYLLDSVIMLGVFHLCLGVYSKWCLTFDVMRKEINPRPRRSKIGRANWREDSA